MTPAELRNIADTQDGAAAWIALHAAAARIEELEAALAFYADETNWIPSMMVEYESYEVQEDAGHRARVALGVEK